MSILSEIGAFMAQKHNDLIEMINGKASKTSTEDKKIAKIMYFSGKSKANNNCFGFVLKSFINEMEQK